MNFLRIRELARKEFLQLFRDKKNRPVLFVMPIIQLLLFGYVVNYDIKLIRVALFDQDHTSQSRNLVETLTGSRIFQVNHHVSDEKELTELLLMREADLAINIPPGFSAAIRKGESAAVQILIDGSMSNMASIRIMYLMQVLNRLNQNLIKEIYSVRMDYARIDARIRAWYNPNLDSQNFFVPGIVAFLIMLISLILTSMAIIKEKEAGTMEQLIVTPIKGRELILGKTIPYIIIAIGQMAVVTTFAKFWFDVPFRGSIFLLFIASCIFLLSTLGTGLFISTIAATQQQAMMTTFFFMLPFFMLSGFVFPIRNMPVFVQWITYLNPMRYFLVIIRGIFLKGVGIDVLWPQYLAMVGLGVVVFTLATLRFKKRLD